MTYNQIKKSETLLYDKSNTPWIVGYINKKGNIDEYLGFHSVLPAPPEIPRASHQSRGAMGRINMVERTPSDRIKDFDIMEIGMTEEEAKHECSRCLRCDHYGYGGFRGAREERWTQW